MLPNRPAPASNATRMGLRIPPSCEFPPARQVRCIIPSALTVDDGAEEVLIHAVTYGGGDWAGRSRARIL